MSTYARRVGIVALTMLAVFVAANWGYFSRLASYYLNPPSVPGFQVPLPRPDERVEPNRLRIRALGVDAPVVYTDAQDEAGFQLALRDGVVHYPGTALPGQPGNSYFFGHSSDFPTAPGDYKHVFALLPQVKAGDRVEVSDPEGRPFVYEVRETKVVEPDDLSVLGQDMSRTTLSLQTSYPVGTALQRFVVVAELVRSE